MREYHRVKINQKANGFTLLVACRICNAAHTSADDRRFLALG